MPGLRERAAGGNRTLDTAENTLQETPETEERESLRAAPARSGGVTPLWIEPDLDFIRAIREQAGDSFEKCFQCGTCSATCTISPDSEPFPRKEMAWATWGMKDLLLRDPDVWLCYQCNDCSTRCPRGARPGDVLAAVRRECVRHYAVPRFLGRWVNQPECIPLLLGIPAALLTAALLLKDPIANGLGISVDTGERLIYAYSSVFPHWLLNSFFLFFSALALLAVVVGAIRFWSAVRSADSSSGTARHATGLVPSIVAVVASVFTHDKFAKCEKAHPRLWSHLFVFFGFLALCVVTVWVITAEYNPFIRGSFVYPFSFWSPWKMLANVGGIALLAGCFLMIRDRIKNGEQISTGSYFDWSLIATLILVILTGYFTEVLHYVRLEPHRHIAYFVHLVFVFTLLVYLPYSKFAHIVYRTVVLVYGKYSGREIEKEPPLDTGRNGAEEE
jgi:quinone-modifying oxidoreductase subunit QmoC